MTRRTNGVLLSALLLGTASAGGDVEPTHSDPWAPMRALEGSWKGQAEGFGQTSDLTHEWRFVLGDKFLRLETRSVARSEIGNGEVHEDVGFVSWSSDDSALRLRHFLSEGFVNTFRVEATPDSEPGLNFEPESSEGAGGMLPRMTLRFLADDSYEMVLALGVEGQEFKPCQTMRMHKVK